jgi:predicted branched-subunit amino acid permease
MGLILLFGGQLLIGLIPLAELPQFLGAFIGAALVVISILLIAFSIFTIFVARALSNHKNWARILLIVCSVAGALTALLSLPSGVVGLLINGAIVYFLGFDKNVIGLFK